MQEKKDSLRGSLESINYKNAPRKPLALAIVLKANGSVSINRLSNVAVNTAVQY